MGIERYFMSEDGKTLRYEEMIRTCDQLIREGVHPTEYFNASRHAHRLPVQEYVHKRRVGIRKAKAVVYDKSLPDVPFIEELKQFEGVDIYSMVDF